MNISRWLSRIAISLAFVSPSAFAQQNDNDLSAVFGDGPDLLSPDVAFQGQLTHADGELTLAFDIAEGYYLYRDKFALAPNDNSVQLGEPEWPQADIYEDPYFGDSAIYRHAFSATVPVKAASSEKTEVSVTYQGCADIGVCFPPTTKTFALANLVAAASAPSTTLKLDGTSNSILDVLKSHSNSTSADSSSDNALSFGSNNDTLLSPAEAYRPFVETTAQGLRVVWAIEPGYYLYRDKLNYELVDATGAKQKIIDVERGASEPYNDEFFGETEIYRQQTSDHVILAAGAKGEGNLTLNYQGCADIGVCFPPDSFTLPTQWNATDGASATAELGKLTNNEQPPRLALSEQDQLAAQLGSSSLWFNAAAFYLFGLLLAFTPCVLPMVPILSSIILGGNQERTTAQALRLSAWYVLGMALTYTIVGVLVGLSGYNIQAWFQNPWILTAFAALFIVFSLAMFGVFELQLPASLQTRLNNFSNKQSGGSASGVFAMGFLSALIVGPCVTAPLMGALIYIADTGNAVVGGVALFALSIGMGTPLLLIGTSAGHWMPRAGSWMVSVKVIFGFLMLAMAIWMLSRFLDPSIVALLSAALAVTTAAWLILEFSQSTQSMGARTIGVAAGLLTGIYGIAILLGALAGSPSLVKPLQGFSAASTGGTTTAATHLAFKRIKSVDELNATIASARASGKAVMLDFYADWCVSCKEMEAFTFTDKNVQAKLANVELIQADVTANDEFDQALLKHFGLFGPPAIIFYDVTGTELRNARVVGYLSAERFADHLDRVLGANTTQSASISR